MRAWHFYLILYNCAFMILNKKDFLDERRRSLPVGFPLVFSIWLIFSPLNNYAIESNKSELSFSRSFYRAVSLYFQGESNLAFQAFTTLLAVSRHDHAAYNEGRCLLRLGILSWDIGKIRDASSYFSAAKNTFKLIGDRLSYKFCTRCLEIVGFYNKGKEERSENSFYSSLKSFEQAISLGRELGLQGFELKCLRQKGLTYRQLGDLSQFFACNQQGLELADRLNNKIEKSRFLNNIGVYYQEQNEYSLSLTCFFGALSIMNEVDDQTIKAECLSNIGILYRDFGDYSKALGYLSKALKLDEATGDVTSISTDTENIGAIYLRRGLDTHNKQDLLKALDIFSNCLSFRNIDKSSLIIRISALNNIGIIKSELSEYFNARDYFAKALEFVRRGNYNLEECNILSNIGATYFYEGRIDLALRYYRKCLEIGSLYSIENAVIESCLGMGQCYEAAKRPSEALLFYKRSISAMEQVRGRISSEYLKIGFARNKMNAYHRVIKVLSDSYFENPTMTLLEEIFCFIEKAKARAFYEDVSKADAKKKPLKNLSMKKNEKGTSQINYGIMHKLNSLNQTGQDKEMLYIDLEMEDEYRFNSELRTDSCYAVSTEQQGYFDISQVRSQIIDEKTGIIEYFLADDRSYLIYITRKKAELYKLMNRNNIIDSIRAYNKMIESSTCNSAMGIAAAKRITREILPFAVEGELSRLKAIIVIPDGILHYLPFETLVTNDKEYFSYLIEDLAISYCPSVSSLVVLRRPRERSVQKKELLALGGAIYRDMDEKNLGNEYNLKTALRKQYQDEGYKLMPLPFSKEEVLEIGELFPKNEKSILIGKDASEEAFKSQPLGIYRLIHFACHGILDEKYPFRSALALSLSNQQGDDGFLQMKEIYNLEINADLVVLSACQTGKGALERTEGPIGLTRSFFHAGARSVISSLWPISDKATVFFMKEFYRFLLKGYSGAKALQLTKIRMLRSAWFRPFYWASFILSGDPIVVSPSN
jgi:CHAT domain-containing protein